MGGGRGRAACGWWTRTLARCSPSTRRAASSRRWQPGRRRPRSRSGQGRSGWRTAGRSRPRSSRGRFRPRCCGSTPPPGRNGRRWSCLRRAARCRTRPATGSRCPRTRRGPSTASGAVVRIDAETATTTRAAGNLGALAIAAGPAGVWALRRGRRRRCSSTRARGRVRLRARLPTEAPTAIAVGDTAAWVSSSTDGHALADRPGRRGGRGRGRLGSGGGRGRRAAHVGREPARGHGHRGRPGLDARGQRRCPVGGIPRSLSVSGDTVWAAVDGEVRAQAPRARGIDPMPASICEPVVGGSESADLLIVSDLPLQGGIRVTATQMAQAITFALRERGFRAGRFRVAYQSCDDSVARTGLFDEAKCAANARAYARQPRRGRCDRNAELALRARRRARAEPRARRPAGDGLAAQLVRRADASGAGRPAGAARVALSDRPAQLPARVPDGRPPGCRARAARPRSRQAARVRAGRRRPRLRGADGDRVRHSGAAPGAAGRGTAPRGIRARAPTRRSPGAWRRRGPTPSSSGACSTRTRPAWSAPSGRRRAGGGRARAGRPDAALVLRPGRGAGRAGGVREPRRRRERAPPARGRRVRAPLRPYAGGRR